MPQIIKNDTTWSGTVRLADDVQVARGVTLTVKPGTQIIGFNRELAIAGVLSAEGNAERPILFDDVHVSGIGDLWGNEGHIILEHVEYAGGSILSGVVEYTTLEASNVIFNQLESAMRFTSEATIDYSVFIQSPGIISDSELLLTNSIIWDQQDTFWLGVSAVATSYGDYAFSENNAYLTTSKTVFLSSGRGKIISNGDYFSGNINNAIIDDNYDITYGEVSITERATTFPDDLKRPLNVYTSTNLPPKLTTAKLIGSRSAELTGNHLDNLLIGNAGANQITGAQGDDTLNGGGGRDRLDGGPGDDVLRGGNGNDRLYGGSGTNRLIGENGNDLIEGGNDRDRLSGGNHNDTLKGGGGADILNGGTGEDSLSGGEGRDTLRGHAEADTLDGGAGNDNLFGGNGNDRLFGGNHNDTLNGQAGSDELHGGNGKDKLIGGNGNDQLSGDAGNDLLVGGAGADVLDGGRNNDTLEGGRGSDKLDGGPGSDLLLGGTLRDELFGGPGNDTLDGGRGNDILSGGKGKDVFMFGPASGRDRIVDFAQGETLDFTASDLDAADLVLKVRSDDMIASFDGAAARVVIEGAANLVTVDDFLFS